MAGGLSQLAGGTLRHLEQLVGGLTAGVILLDLAGTIIWANDAALAMHGVRDLAGLGATADEYAQRFALSLPDGHRLTAREYPLMRVLAGESFADLTVHVAAAGSDEPRWTHHVRDVVLTGDDQEPEAPRSSSRTCRSSLTRRRGSRRCSRRTPRPR